MRIFSISLRALPIMVAAVAQSACVYQNHANWWIGDVAPDRHDCRAMTGARAVLDLQRFRSVIVVPFAWGGYRLFVITDPTLLNAGSSLSIPSGEATAILCDLRHGAPGDPIRDLSGTVRVVRERRGDLLIQLDLSQPQGEWSFSGTNWFARKEAAE